MSARGRRESIRRARWDSINWRRRSRRVAYLGEHIEYAVRTAGGRSLLVFGSRRERYDRGRSGASCTSIRAKPRSGTVIRPPLTGEGSRNERSAVESRDNVLRLRPQSAGAAVCFERAAPHRPTGTAARERQRAPVQSRLHRRPGTNWSRPPKRRQGRRQRTARARRAHQAARSIQKALQHRDGVSGWQQQPARVTHRK